MEAKPPEASSNPAPEGGAQVDQLMVQLQEELRRIAARELGKERADHMLQPTALVNEAYLRLAGQHNLGEASRGTFLAAAAQTMRRILVEVARARSAEKRGGRWDRVTLSGLDAQAAQRELDLLDLNDALQRLGKENERMASVVVLRYFGGLTVQEAAESLGVSARTVADDWTFARAWLMRELNPLRG
jgi:RNA polymerase sigma-70 factor (ECF subfamily)